MHFAAAYLSFPVCKLKIRVGDKFKPRTSKRNEMVFIVFDESYKGALWLQFWKMHSLQGEIFQKPTLHESLEMALLSGATRAGCRQAL